MSGSPKRLLLAESDPTRYLPYARHATPSIVALGNGELMALLALEGMAFETADIADLNDWHEKLNIALRSIAHERVAVMSHVVRTRSTAKPIGQFRTQFSEQLDRDYWDRLAASQLFDNRQFLTLVLRPAVGRADRAAHGVLQYWRRGTGGQAEAEAYQLERMEELVRDVLKLLGRLEPHLLGCYERRGLAFSEVLEFLDLVMTGRRRAIPVVRGHLGGSLYADRLIFGREVIEIREAGSSRFAGIVGVREHAAQTFPGQLNALLDAPFEFVLGQGFCFLGKAGGMETARRRHAQMSATDDRAWSQAEELESAMDDLQSGRFVLGDHHLGLTVFAATPKELGDAMSLARASLSEGGIVAAREDIALEAAYWAQLPGNFAFRPRPAAITSRNFAGLSPFHGYPRGTSKGNHWGDAITLLRTTARTPFHFNFHSGDVGHTLIIGPSGAGKTVIQNFLLSQAEKAGARIVFIDKDRGAEIFVRAVGGSYLALKSGEPSGFAPLKAIEHTPANLDFLLGWLCQLVTDPDESLKPHELAALRKALKAVGRMPSEARSIGALRSQLPQAALDGVGARLQRWVAGGELGWVFDNDRDMLSLDAQLVGFDMTEFLDNERVRTLMMSYLFHRIDEIVDGKPVIVDIDEFWKALGDEAFRAFARDGLKTYRKRNAVMMFGTQSPADALRSSIAETIIEQCATKILLPNPNATEEHYMGGLHLTRAEFDLIKRELSPESRRFIVKQGHRSVVVELGLDGLDDALAVLSGRTSTVALLDQIRAEVGDDPQAWLPLFHARRRVR